MRFVSLKTVLFMILPTMSLKAFANPIIIFDWNQTLSHTSFEDDLTQEAAKSALFAGTSQFLQDVRTQTGGKVLVLSSKRSYLPHISEGESLKAGFSEISLSSDSSADLYTSILEDQSKITMVTINAKSSAAFTNIKKTITESLVTLIKANEQQTPKIKQNIIVVGDTPNLDDLSMLSTKSFKAIASDTAMTIKGTNARYQFIHTVRMKTDQENHLYEQLYQQPASQIIFVKSWLARLRSVFTQGIAPSLVPLRESSRPIPVTRFELCQAK